MRKNLRLTLALALVVFSLPLAISINTAARSHVGGSMQIGGLPLHNVSVTGTWNPDFLWAGKAWRIEVESDQPFQLKLDDQSYEIPKGSHVIYSNHDHTNTGRFGSKEFWGYPGSVEVRSLQ